MFSRVGRSKHGSAKQILHGLTLLALVALSSISSLEARWERIHDFNRSMSLVHFISPTVGFAGSGWVSTPGKVFISKTIDGGRTWSECPSPTLNPGVLTSISIKGQVGYAAIYAPGLRTDHSIWKTTDGGDTWFDLSPGTLREAVNVIDAGRSLVVSTWEGGGWVNLTPSQAWVNELPSRTNGAASNGTDVVVTDFDYREWFSTDGGGQWQRANNIPEAWSVYNLEGTRSFYTANEGDADDPQREIYRSMDGGASWQMLYRFPDPAMTFTGHIEGKGTRLYVQSAVSAGLGMYRSDDLGLSWKRVGGPSGNRDTRFAVQGCGEIVYALDDQGVLYKTMDGGDSTFVADGFYLGEPLGAIVGDTVDIPLFARNIPKGTTINGTQLRLEVDRDLLDNWSTTSGTITAEGNVLDLDLVFNPPLMDTLDLRRPVAIFRAKNYLTTRSTLELELNTIDIQASSLTSPCGVSVVTYMQLPSCGDATIRGSLLKVTEAIKSLLPSLVTTTATIELANATGATLSVIDLLGREYSQCIDGDQLSAERLPAGAYVLILSRNGKILDRKSFFVAH